MLGGGLQYVTNEGVSFFFKVASQILSCRMNVKTKIPGQRSSSFIGSKYLLIGFVQYIFPVYRVIIRFLMSSGSWGQCPPVALRCRC